MGRLAGQAKTPLEKLKDYSPTFLEYRNRYHRSLVHVAGRLICGDPKLDLSFRTSENHINGLLEGYFFTLVNDKFAETVGVELEEPPTIDIPIKHTQEVHMVDFDGA